ncbi:hypothetical protein BRAO375_1700032 [Bradyrhizobium sp. ORS 375]|nr:hypothetical protein BRAO375_1700032 [Bradyrhizobium sp. ORS 375]
MVNMGARNSTGFKSQLAQQSSKFPHKLRPENINVGRHKPCGSHRGADPSWGNQQHRALLRLFTEINPAPTVS